MNWRLGFFRAWVLISVVWVIGWAFIYLPGAGSKIAKARMSNAEIMSNLDECKPFVPPPPEGFYLVECLNRLAEYGRQIERWGGGDAPTEQAFRVTRAFLLELGILFIAPFCLLLGFGWVVGAFTKHN
jgi:hypothetical protein